MSEDKRFDEYYDRVHLQGGTTCCPGCGGPLLWRMILDAVGTNTIVYGDGPCAMCAIRNIKLPNFSIHFSFAADGATGIAAALRAKGREDVTVVSSAGDGSAGQGLVRGTGTVRLAATGAWPSAERSRAVG